MYYILLLTAPLGVYTSTVSEQHIAFVLPSETARHDYELPIRKETVLHTDAAHGPIGGDMAWSTGMSAKYALTGSDYHLNLCLKLEDYNL